MHNVTLYAKNNVNIYTYYSMTATDPAFTIHVKVMLALKKLSNIDKLLMIELLHIFHNCLNLLVLPGSTFFCISYFVAGL